MDFRRSKDSKPVRLILAKVPPPKTLERGHLFIDAERQACRWKGNPVTLTVTEFLILQALAINPGVVKSRDKLMDVAYDEETYVDDRTIDSHIKRLRRKLRGVDESCEPIETLYGVGYRLKDSIPSGQ